jgi:hypothetical protein
VGGSNSSLVGKLPLFPGRSKYYLIKRVTTKINEDLA